MSWMYFRSCVNGHLAMAAWNAWRTSWPMFGVGLSTALMCSVRLQLTTIPCQLAIPVFVCAASSFLAACNCRCRHYLSCAFYSLLFPSMAIFRHQGFVVIGDGPLASSSPARNCSLALLPGARLRINGRLFLLYQSIALRLFLGFRRWSPHHHPWRRSSWILAVHPVGCSYSHVVLANSKRSSVWHFLCLDPL